MEIKSMTAAHTPLVSTAGAYADRRKLLRASKNDSLTVIDNNIEVNKLQIAASDFGVEIGGYPSFDNLPRTIRTARADSGGWRSAFRTDADHDSEVMAISIPS
jgi:hypothetical protein